MKRRIFIIALALAAVTAAVGTTLASLLPVNVDLYVYNGTTEGAGTLKLVTTQTYTTAPVVGTTGNITIQIKDTRTNTVVSRIARNASGQPLVNSSASTIVVTAVTIP